MSNLFNTIQEFIVSVLSKILPYSDGFPPEVATAVNTFVAYLNGVNFLFPVSTLLRILALYLVFELILFIFHFGRYIINLIRGSSA